MSSPQIGSQGEVTKTYAPVMGGVLNIINGAIEMLSGLTLIGIVKTITLFEDTWNDKAIGLLLIIAGAVAIIGGIFSCRRKAWRLALIGAVSSLFPLKWTLTSIFALILIFTSKREFK